MRRQMHRSQAALQLGNSGRLGREAVRRDFAFGKKLVENPFACNQNRAEWFGGGAHALEDHRHFASLAFAKPELRVERQHMHRAGIPIQLGGLRHPHPLALA